MQYAHWATAVLMNGLGRYEEALAAASRAIEGTPQFFGATWALGELIEAAMRTGHAERAQQALARLDEQTEGSDCLLGARHPRSSRALVSEGEAAQL